MKGASLKAEHGLIRVGVHEAVCGTGPTSSSSDVSFSLPLSKNAESESTRPSLPVCTMTSDGSVRSSSWHAAPHVSATQFLGHRT